MKFFETINGSKDNSKNGVTQPSQSSDAYTVQWPNPFMASGNKGIFEVVVQLFHVAESFKALD